MRVLYDHAVAPRGHKIAHHTPTSIRDASFGSLFYALSGQDVVVDAHASLQRSLTQIHGSSLDEWRCAADLRTDCLAREPVGIVHRRSRAVHHPPDARNTVVIHLQNSRSCVVENEASQPLYLTRMVRAVQYRLLYPPLWSRTPCATEARSER